MPEDKKYFVIFNSTDRGDEYTELRHVTVGELFSLEYADKIYCDADMEDINIGTELLGKKLDAVTGVTELGEILSIATTKEAAALGFVSRLAESAEVNEWK